MWINSIEGYLVNLNHVERIHIEPLNPAIDAGEFVVLADLGSRNRVFLFQDPNENKCKNYVNALTHALSQTATDGVLTKEILSRVNR